VPAYLIRHAHAGSRSSWRGDDERRPLSPKGEAQADAIAEKLKTDPVGAILSSPSLRCVQTVEPLAKRHGLPLDTDERLLEGADADAAIDLLHALASHDPALCSHGDLIPKMVRRLVASGMKTKDANISQKGSMWVVELEGDRPVKGRYVPPGAPGS
jgi:phosphohistidine phosphatase SixA